ncbi:MAG: hypothetical protein MMC23_002995 [Stictis urceolatum]|nr:hypothetical protein [Stictis urceolata]
MSLPDESQIATNDHKKKYPKNEMERHPLRTREEVHICAASDSDSDDEEGYLRFSPASVHTASSDLSCHNHRLDYVSSSSPFDSDSFSSLRRATVRTLSGEQLPRGQSSGPLWFGDPSAGYTIAYVFRLADMHARGRQRYYCLLALAGTDTQRAFEACTMIWALFEQIAMHIVRTAEEVAGRSAVEDSPPDRGEITPISSFLTGRTMDPDGFPRRGAANVRPNGIADLVDNENFFCELHMMFVGMLQELGRLLGGMRVRPVEELAELKEKELMGEVSSTSNHEHNDEHHDVQHNNAENRKLSAPSVTSGIRYATPMNSPGLVSHRQEVVV